MGSKAHLGFTISLIEDDKGNLSILLWGSKGAAIVDVNEFLDNAESFLQKSEEVDRFKHFTQLSITEE